MNDPEETLPEIDSTSDTAPLERTIPLEPTPSGGQAPPHGCLTALVLAVALAIPAAVGFVWLSGLFQPKVGFLTIVAAIYALALIVPFGLVALFLRNERFALWRGVALALALAGGHAALVGGLSVFDVSLPWPGVPVWVGPLVSIGYSLAIVAAGWRHFLGKPAAGPILLGLGTGLLLSLGWVFVGALGTPVEVLLAPLEAASSALLSAALVASIFFYDPGLPERRPFWSAVIAGAVFAGLLSGMLAVRGYFLQGQMVGTALSLFGLSAGVLLTLGENPQPKRLWWAALVFFFVVFLVPFAWTEGFEGEWMPDDLTPVWGTALVISGASGLVLAAILLALRRPLVRLAARPLAPGLFSLFTLLVTAGVYLGLGQPGIQPDVFFVVLKDQADTGFAASISDRDERVTAVYETLTAQALESQADLRAFLDSRGVSYTPYYLVNGIEAVGTPILRREVAARPDVAYILDSPHARPLPSFGKPLPLIPPSPASPGLSWGVDDIDAEQVWQQFGVTGEGIIVGEADSGVDWNHPALHDQYLNADSDTTGAHDYTWFDPWYGTTKPVDTSGHGTHTLGTILGQGGIGVAPGARWIGCRNLARNLGDPAYYLDCMQFLFAPHPQTGDPFTEGDPTRGAHVTNNSWGCPPQEGCDGRTLAIAVTHLYDAGQMFVVSAGNDGPDCSTVWSPASADDALSVGASTESHDIAQFSSRGPVLADGSGRIKPDVAAPGVRIYSSIPGGDYGYSQGTSMAGPHVTGLVALLWSANPDLIGDVDTTEQIIDSTARFIPADTLCGGVSDEENNDGGYGEVDALEAVRMALETVE
jgi:hypothetical protein